MKNKVELVIKKKSDLGESPSWDEKNQILYWVDILKASVYCFDPKKGKHFYHDLREDYTTIGCVVPYEDDKVILAADCKIISFNLITKEKIILIEVDKDKQNNRFNDGKCDPKGRIIAGTMSIISGPPNGSLFSFDNTKQKSSQLKTLKTDITISNGITWSPDYKTMYFIDSDKHNILAFDYDLENGSLSNERIVVRLQENVSYVLDGMTSDQEGMLWTALWGGNAVVRWNPKTGEQLERYEVPAPYITSVVFGGKDLDELYITSASVEQSREETKTYPLGGSLFKLKTNVKGIPTFRFKDNQMIIKDNNLIS